MPAVPQLRLPGHLRDAAASELRTAPGFLVDALKARGIAVQRIDFADDDVTTLHAQAAGIAEQT